MKYKLTLDRIEHNIAICLDANNTEYNIPSHILKGVKEGDIFTCQKSDNGEIFDVILLENETRSATSAAKARLNNLFNRGGNKK